MARDAITTDQTFEQIAGEAATGNAADNASTLEGIAAAARATLGADRASLYVVDVDTQNVASVYTTETDPKRKVFLGRSVGRGMREMPIWQLHLTRPDPLLVIEDLDHSPAVPEALATRLGSGALIGVRLEHDSVRQAGSAALLGTLFCSYAKPRRFSATDLRAARGLAGLATLTLANARLRAETVESLSQATSLAAEQSALGRVATHVAADAPPMDVFRQTAEEVAGLLGVELGLVARFGAGRAVPVGWCGAPIDVAFPIDGGGALAQVARTGQVARVGNYKSLANDHVGRLVESRGYRSGIAAPVRVAGQLWGALLAATTKPSPIGAEAEARLERFADLVALAIGNAEDHARLIAQAATDPLTGLANHRTFFERLDAEVRRARRRGDPLSLAIFDLDHFKQVNDTHGHLVGDAVLTETGARLSSLAGAEDTLARIGGEEFAWLLPDTDAQAAWLAGECARRVIAEQPFEVAGKMTISAGVAELRESLGVTELFRRADKALYWAKGHGRGICVRYAPAHEHLLEAEPPDVVGRLATGAERLVALAHEQVGLTATVLTEFGDDELAVRAGAGDVAAFGLDTGTEVPLGGTYLERVLDDNGQQLVRDAQRERHARFGADVHLDNVGAYVGVPVRLPTGVVFGTLCCLSRRAEPGLGARDLRTVRIIAGMLAEELDLAEHAGRAHKQTHERLRALLTGHGHGIVLQPIVDLTDGRVVAVEALSRFEVTPARAPSLWFADAATLGLTVELELLAIRGAIAQMDAVPRGARLSVNASPGTIQDPGFWEAVASFPCGRLAIEITEHAPIDDHPALQDALAELRNRGAQVVVDDAGAGFASFKHILDLQPDVIKLDLSLTRDLDTDPLRRALAASLLGLAEEIGAIIVAEGIETRGELEALKALGVHLGQGYLLGRPEPGPVGGQIVLPGSVAMVDAS